MAKNIIKRDSVLSNLFDQKTGKLISVSILRTKDLCKEFRMMFKTSLPNGTCIQCIYSGENHLTFMEIKRYGSASWRNLESRIGQIFEIEQESDAKQESFELINQEATE